MRIELRQNWRNLVRWLSAPEHFQELSEQIEYEALQDGQLQVWVWVMLHFV